MVSTKPTLILCSLNILPKSSAAPRPQSLFTTRKSALPILSLSTILANATASTDDGGEMRKMYGFPDVVILPADEVSTSIGTLSSLSFGMIASVQHAPHAPIIHGSLARTMSVSAPAAASFGLLLVSSITSSSFLPSTPPLALISSAAIFAPFATYFPDAANAPVSG